MNKNILLGVTGGIAAYKMVNVASTLTKKGYNVKVVMTESATEFVTPLTFRSVTHNRVATEMFSTPDNYNVKHVSLAEHADTVLIAPATANFIAKMAQGLADDLLSTLILATEAPIMIAPSMNKNMYQNAIVQDNIEYLKKNGIEIIAPNTGYLACGDKGEGRLPEPELLSEFVIKKLTDNKFKDYQIMITAGPTREAIDSVRYLSNYASGKMGYALARAACYQGGEVTLISGPTELDSAPGVNLKRVTSAREMDKMVKQYAPEQDIIIMTAAVSDFRPELEKKQKLKKECWDGQLNLVSNPDILAELGQNKKDDQILVGFAAETDNLISNSQQKLEEKNLDMIIANDISRDDIGFASDENQVVIMTDQTQKELNKMSKLKLAYKILEQLYLNYIK